MSYIYPYNTYNEDILHERGFILRLADTTCILYLPPHRFHHLFVYVWLLAGLRRNYPADISRTCWSGPESDKEEPITVWGRSIQHYETFNFFLIWFCVWFARYVFFLGGFYSVIATFQPNSSSSTAPWSVFLPWSPLAKQTGPEWREQETSRSSKAQ